MLNAERAVMENPRRELVFVGPAPGFSVLLKRNCCSLPRSSRTAGMPPCLLSSNGRDFEVGRHLHERAPAKLAAELAKRMRN